METKEYYFGKDVDYAATYLVSAVAQAILIRPQSIIWHILIMLAFIFLTHRKYYPFFARLIICDEYVEKTAFGYSFAKLSRKHLQVSIRLIKHKQFIVFSSVPTAHLLLPDIRKVVRKGKAIMYPVTEKMREDFPQFFQGKALPA